MAYVKTLTISAAAGAGSDYQVCIKVGESAATLNTTVNLDTPTQSFPTTRDNVGDIGFRYNGAFLPIWVEKVTYTTPTRIAYCWVKLPFDVTNGGEIELIYDTGLTLRPSNGDEVFMLFDDFSVSTFDTNKWTGSPQSISGGNLAVYGGNIVRTANLFDDNIEMVGYVRSDSQYYSSSACSIFGFVVGSQGYVRYFNNSAWQIVISGASYNILSDGPSNWRRLQVQRSGGAGRVFIDEVLRWDTATDGGAFPTAQDQPYITSSSTYRNGYVDWAGIKKCVLPEPSIVAVGPEDNAALGAAVSGLVIDDAGFPAGGRTIRVYRRDTGALLGETQTSPYVGSAGDPYYNNVSLLLHMDGAAGSTVFTDNSLHAHDVVANGNVQISSVQSVFGSSSGAFDGSGDFLSALNAAAFDFGTGDFTIEARIFKTAGLTTTSNIVALEGGAGNRWAFYWRGASSSLSIYNGSVLIAGSTSLALNTWYHVAFVRENGEFRIYLDGVLDGSVTPAIVDITGHDLFIGQSGVGTEYWPGYIDEVRITKGFARYTADFTPPTEAFPNNGVLPDSGGEYTFYTHLYTGEVQVVCLDDTAGVVYNDLIHRSVPT